jgi:hypothetical protein
MEEAKVLANIIYILLGIIVVLMYALLFIGKHGILTGKEDEDE